MILRTKNCFTMMMATLRLSRIEIREVPFLFARASF